MGLSLLIASLISAAVSTPVNASSLEPVFSILEKTPTGKAALDHARAKKLPIISGKISKTDIVATRIVKGSEERLEYSVQVILSADKHPVFQAIDLAHELVHALNPKANPFDPNLTAADYVQQGIESESGEAAAIAQECKVGKELLDEELSSEVNPEQAQLIKARCQYVWKSENKPQWKLSFYHLGNQIQNFTRKFEMFQVESEQKDAFLKMIVPKDPVFTSAAANKPYPLALLDEYVEITKKICSKSALQARCQSLSSALFSH